MFLAAITPLESRLIGTPVAIAVGALALWVIRMARGDERKPIAIYSLTHRRSDRTGPMGRPWASFVADVPGQAPWEPYVFSCTPTMPGSRGPRYLIAVKMPSGREFTGMVELTKNDPGVQVVLQMVGSGASGDFWSFGAQDGGTLVTQRTVVQVPYLMTLTGTLLTTVRAIAPEAHQRRVDELQALKAAFESQS